MKAKLTFFLAGGIVGVLGWIVLSAWLDSSVRAVEQASGLDLPLWKVTLTQEVTSFSMFQGEGFILRTFGLPDELAKQMSAKCPAGFARVRMDQTDIWVHNVTSDAAQMVCFSRVFSEKEGDWDAVVVTQGGTMYHLAVYN